jgi:hypothetical protein
MKTLAIIWALVIITGSGTAVYISKSVDKLALIASQAYQVQPADGIDLGNTVCLQNCQPGNIQPASNYTILLTNSDIK